MLFAAWAVAAIVLVVALVPVHYHEIGILAGGADLWVYRDGGWRALHGMPIYGVPVVLGLLYTYTPFSTLVFVPLQAIPGGVVTELWMGVNVLVLVACIALAWRLAGYRLSPRLLAVSFAMGLGCTFLEPVRTTLFYGQINLWLMLAVLWDVSRGRNSRLAGIGIGLAAAVKLTPLYFVAYYLVLRRWRAAAVATGTFAATIALAWAVLPGESHRYWTRTFFDSNRIADDEHPSNQSLRGMIAHLTGGPGPIWVWLLGSAVVVAGSMALVFALERRGERLLGVTLAGLTAAVVSPFSWSHHWVWLVPLTVVLVERALVRGRWWWGVLGVFAVAGAWPFHWGDGPIVVGLFLYPPSWPTAWLHVNVYLWLYIAVVAAVAGRLVRERRRARVASATAVPSDARQPVAESRDPEPRSDPAPEPEPAP
ncbi:glycosyltransferase 87 family protein [Rhodococcus rhodnii]|uniref:glycosyltransferase 87 family protein n=1 Tax=Rhodococcus rhodnii TaxID=38312 RepID=UPI001EE6EA0C|nr:glycosyltransferase 87 family protein [Rhodococcus rhodnii]